MHTLEPSDIPSHSSHTPIAGQLVLLDSIPRGSRVVVRTVSGVDEFNGRAQYSDFLGHIMSHDESTLILERDPSADGTRPAETVHIDIARIVRIKPIPERRMQR